MHSYQTAPTNGPAGRARPRSGRQRGAHRRCCLGPLGRTGPSWDRQQDSKLRGDHPDVPASLARGWAGGLGPGTAEPRPRPVPFARPRVHTWDRGHDRTRSVPARSAAYTPGRPPRGEVRTGTVAGFGERGDVLVRLDGDDPQAPTGSIPGHLLTWAAFEDPSEVVSVGQRITAEVLGVDERTGEVALSARACEDEALYLHLRRTRRGDVVSGTVAAVHDFGVFVRLDGEPPHPSHPGTGFIRVPDLARSHVDRPEDVVQPGQRLTGEVATIDTHQGEVVVSLKALQEHPKGRS
ncbi:S1 RNA-binding domain-containing protein [Streptomyces sp. NPDC101151]|uniref:S1 RNA-binding domain-containing protein n=1 Tax=Streptomyces sp. NPDC101151 TaxID=3366115 RepID=UPI0037F417CA